MILFTKYFFKVNWGKNFGMLILICFSLTFLSTILGIFLAMVNKKNGDAILNILVPIFTFLSGGYFKFSIDNKIGELLKNVVPNTLAQNAIFNNIYTNDILKVTNSIAIIWIIIIILFIGSLIAGRRKKA